VLQELLAGNTFFDILESFAGIQKDEGEES
jgi:hypothetical protein